MSICAICGKEDDMVGIFGYVPADFSPNVSFEFPGDLSNYQEVHDSCMRKTLDTPADSVVE